MGHFGLHFDNVFKKDAILTSRFNYFGLFVRHPFFPAQTEVLFKIRQDWCDPDAQGDSWVSELAPLVLCGMLRPLNHRWIAGKVEAELVCGFRSLHQNFSKLGLIA